jgi:3-dehydroquinate synthase
LSDHDWIGGISEAFKVAIIQDAEFLKTLCRSARKLRARDEEAMEHLIRRCAELHMEHIRTSGDPFEYGRARPLDFGHWSAHQLEFMSGYRIGHGHAVAIGIALDSCYATRQGWLTGKEFEAVFKGLKDSGFNLWSDELERRSPHGRLEILDGLKNFQEHLGGELYITFPKGIGQKFEVQEVDERMVEDCVAKLKVL